MKTESTANVIARTTFVRMGDYVVPIEDIACVRPGEEAGCLVTIRTPDLLALRVNITVGEALEAIMKARDAMLREMSSFA